MKQGRPRNEHGGGAKGIGGCPCDLCKEARRKHSLAYEQAHPNRDRHRAANNPNKATTSVPHGGGAKGRKDCTCEPCVKRRRQYESDYYRRRKAQGKA